MNDEDTEDMSDEEVDEELARCPSGGIAHCVDEEELNEIWEQVEAERRRADAIAESPVWKDPQFLKTISEHFMAKDLEKNRETTKHYIDSAEQPPLGPQSRMGHPKRGADGQVLRDANGRVIWETNEEVEKVPRANVMADGRIDPTKSIMGNPVRQADGSIKWEVK